MREDSRPVEGDFFRNSDTEGQAGTGTPCPGFEKGGRQQLVGRRDTRVCFLAPNSVLPPLFCSPPITPAKHRARLIRGQQERAS